METRKPIRNVVFDIGNVFVRWAPLESLAACFPDVPSEPLWAKIRSDWRALNRGEMSLEELYQRLVLLTGLPKEGFEGFLEKIMGQATFFSGTLDLQAQLARAGLCLYALSDNIKEVIAYYRHNHTFMDLFKGSVISADIGILKPDPQIYRFLFAQYGLDPATCVFFDDLDVNVAAAEKEGMRAFVFTTAEACESDLRSLGLDF